MESLCLFFRQLWAPLVAIGLVGDACQICCVLYVVLGGFETSSQISLSGGLILMTNTVAPWGEREEPAPRFVRLIASGHISRCHRHIMEAKPRIW